MRRRKGQRDEDPSRHVDSLFKLLRALPGDKNLWLDYREESSEADDEWRKKEASIGEHGGTTLPEPFIRGLLSGFVYGGILKVATYEPRKAPTLYMIQLGFGREAWRPYTLEEMNQGAFHNNAGGPIAFGTFARQPIEHDPTDRGNRPLTATEVDELNATMKRLFDGNDQGGTA